MDDHPKSRLIHALDLPTLDEARAAAERVRGEIGVAKVGLELFSRYGPDAASCGQTANAPVFLDLKLHDIPATVGRAVENLLPLADQGVRYLTVHAAGGRAMLSRAVEASQGRIHIIAVTVLTSLDADDLRSTGIARDTLAQVQGLAHLAFDAGVRHFVCAPTEASTLRRALGDQATIITPGVRPAGSAHGDQKRVTTPADAIAGGADMLVVGRPIRDADDPRQAAKSIVSEIGRALKER